MYTKTADKEKEATRGACSVKNLLQGLLLGFALFALAHQADSAIHLRRSSKEPSTVETLDAKLAQLQSSLTESNNALSAKIDSMQSQNKELLTKMDSIRDGNGQTEGLNKELNGLTAKVQEVHTAVQSQKKELLIQMESLRVGGGTNTATSSSSSALITTNSDASSPLKITTFPVDPAFPLNPNRQLATFQKPAQIAGTKIWVHDPKECRWISGKLVSTGQFEHYMQQALMDFLPPNNGNTLFVDIGGNLGTFSIAMAAAGYTVEAFEPMQYNVELFSNSIQENSFQDRISLYQVAVSDAPKEKVCLQAFRSYKRSPNQGNGRVTADAPDTGHNCVPLVRVDSIMSRCPDLVKVDVEGLEVPALKGMGVSQEGSCRPKGIAMEDNPDLSGGSIVKYLQSLGYACKKLQHKDHMCSIMEP